MLPLVTADPFPEISVFFDNKDSFDFKSSLWIEGIEIWLSMQTRSESTYRNYKKESERFLLWCIYINKIPFHELGIKDIKSYSNFIVNIETICPTWCGNRRSRKSNKWKPFVGNLSNYSHDVSLTILQTLFQWLVADNRVEKNPFKLLIDSKKATSKQLDIANAFTKKEINIIQCHIDNLPTSTEEKRRIKARYNWVFNLIIMTGLRCEEVVNTKFSSVYMSNNVYFLSVNGKGNKQRVIPLNDNLLKLMIEYRQFFDLSPYPKINDCRYLVFSVRGYTRLTVRAMHKSIKNLFKDCSDSVEDIYLKKKLLLASPHWLRGSFATLVNDHTDHATLQNLMGHSSYNTTLRYIRIEDSKSVDAVNSISL